jgi:hypothetical protein
LRPKNVVNKNVKKEIAASRNVKIRERLTERKESVNSVKLKKRERLIKRSVIASIESKRRSERRSVRLRELNVNPRNCRDKKPGKWRDNKLLKLPNLMSVKRRHPMLLVRSYRADLSHDQSLEADLNHDQDQDLNPHPLPLLAVSARDMLKLLMSTSKQKNTLLTSS